MSVRTVFIGLLLASAAALAAPPTTEQLLKDTENAWSQAYVTGDAAWLDKLMAPEYLFTDTDGKTYNRDDDISAVKSGEWKMTSFKMGDLKVHVYGDVATVTGLNDFVATDHGKDASCKCRFTDVFVKRDGRWQAVASHVSKVTS
ncbi:MAG TPA: nuclear transport factor 2 family protein [Steroidobacteraceae bacterium]|nr:nuclear transport factor 2 family protein [Steroidobacteraceae bacterium]